MWRDALHAAATIINGMRPQTIGRALGFGIRIAGRIAGQQLAAHAQSGAPQSQFVGNTAGSAAQNRADAQAAGRIAGQTSRGVARGVGGFLRPFRRVGGILWLEITGAFFLLFATVFALRLWQNWAGFSRNPLSRNVVMAAAAVFLYLGVSSFWRARRR